MARRPHADLIHAYAEGAEIEFLTDVGWMPTNPPEWHSDTQYRIKPKETPWFENIPPHGVLCWVSDYSESPNSANLMRVISEHKSYGFIESNSLFTVVWRYATPLMDKEIKQFLRGE